MNRLLTRDPASGAELVVTRFWCPSSGVVIEGEFALGWVAKLSPDQLDFVGLLLLARNNLQRLAAELGVSYNTARSRLDEIVDALGGDGAPDEQGPSTAGPSVANAKPSVASTKDASIKERRLAVLSALAAGEIGHEEALRRLRQ
jgi:hypothetical protein